MEIIPYTPDLYEQLMLFLIESFLIGTKGILIGG